MFQHIREIKLIVEPKKAQSNYWLQAIILDEKVQDKFEDILNLTNHHGFTTRPIWTPLHKLAPYDDCQKMDLSRAESLALRVINLPSSSNLMQDLP